MAKQLSLIDKFLRIFFRYHYEILERNDQLAEKFPCKSCRPNAYETFYYGIETKCNVCGRVYHF